MCGISKATYYNNKSPKDRLLEKYEKIKKYVDKIIVKNSSYGIRRIKAALKEDYKIEIGRDTLGKLLILWGLSLKRKNKKPKISVLRKILIRLSDKVNLLIRSKIIEPLQAITSDITELVYENGKCYFCVHKDVLGQMVYGFKVSKTMDDSITRDSLKQASKTIKKLTKKFVSNKKKKIKNKTKILFHQDQGSQYTSYAYVEDVMKIGTISYSTPGTPTENPGQESFFGRFKEDYADEIREMKTFEEVERFIKKKMKYYNHKRIHTSIGYTNPYSFTKSFFEKSNLNNK